MIKLQKLVESKEALARLIKCSLPIGITWDLKGFIKNVNSELSTFEEIKNQKILEFGEEVKDEKGNSQGTKVKPENVEEFYKVINELLDKDINIIIPEVKVEVLKDYKDSEGKGISISTTDLMILDWLIIE